MKAGNAVIVVSMTLLIVFAVCAYRMFFHQEQQSTAVDISYEIVADESESGLLARDPGQVALETQYPGGSDKTDGKRSESIYRASNNERDKTSIENLSPSQPNRDPTVSEIYNGDLFLNTMELISPTIAAILKDVEMVAGTLTDQQRKEFVAESPAFKYRFIYLNMCEECYLTLVEYERFGVQRVLSPAEANAFFGSGEFEKWRRLVNEKRSSGRLTTDSDLALT